MLLLQPPVSILFEQILAMNLKCKEASLKSEGTVSPYFSVKYNENIRLVAFLVLNHNNNVTLHSSAAWCNETQNHVKDDYKIMKLDGFQSVSSQVMVGWPALGPLWSAGLWTTYWVSLQPPSLQREAFLSLFSAPSQASWNPTSQPAWVPVHSVALL